MLRLTRPADLPDRSWGVEVQKTVNAGPRENPVIDFALMKAHIIAGAEMAHYPYPQYKGYWDGDEWRLICIPKRFRAKSGIAWEAGDWTIMRRQDNGESAYSLRLNGMVQYKAFDSVADPKAAHRNDPMPVYKTLDTGLDARYSAMLVKLSGHELDEEFTRDWFETLYSLMQAALGASNEPVGEWAPLFATVLDKYDQLLAEPAMGWHDGFGNQ